RWLRSGAGENLMRTFAVRRALGGPVVTAVCLLFADLAASPARAADKEDGSLPLTKVVLFNSGVGFFQHDTEIEGQKKIELKFNVNDINDLLKSMVLQDLGGGRIATVTYSSRE